MVRLRFIGIVLFVAYLVGIVALLGAGPEQQDSPPEPPNIYSGAVTIAGNAAPDGVEIFARVGSYQSNVAREGFDERPMVLVKNGEYKQLVVQPAGGDFFNQTLTFHATIGGGDVQAQETATFRQGLQIVSDFNLTFSQAPGEPPTPVPPTPTPAATATATPLPTPGLPISGDPSVPNLSRVALIAGIVAVVAGGTIILLMRRRRVF